MGSLLAVKHAHVVDLDDWSSGCLVFVILLSATRRVAVTLERCSGPKHQILWVTFIVGRLKQTKPGPKGSNPRLDRYFGVGRSP